MIVGSFTARFAHGLLIVAAPESTDSHDDWDPATEMFHATDDSLYIGVRDAVSGLVTVTCREGRDHAVELPLRFVGRLALPTARLHFYDPNETISMILPMPSESVELAVHADDGEEPSELVFLVG